MSTIRECPDPSTLERFLLGRVAGSAADTIEEHVAACARCGERMTQVSVGDGLISSIARPSAVLEAVDLKQIDEFLTRLHLPNAEITSSEAMSATPHSAPKELDSLGRYRVVREVGRGGMGVVYAADDTRLHRLVALKVIHEARLLQPDCFARFQREAEALARLNHPNIVQVHEAGSHRGRPYLVLEFVAGGTLAHWLNGQPQPPEVSAALIADLADAVNFAHVQGVIHRDLKPSNILLARDDAAPEYSAGSLPTPPPRANCILGTPKITDFGLARTLGDEGHTQTGDVLGTPSYMAPESTRVESATRDSLSIDIYSLGAILYEMLTGRPPFRGETVADTLDQLRTLEPISPRRLHPRVPRDLETICLKCLRKEPARRYSSAAELAADLRRFLDHRPIVARPTSRLERLIKWARRKPAWAALGVVSLAAFVVLLVTGVLYEQRLRGALVRAEQNEQAARREKNHARDNYREARTALDQMLSRAFDPRRPDVPRLQELRREQRTDALAFYLKIAEQEPDPDPEVRWDIAQARLLAGSLQHQLGRSNEGKENLVVASRLLQDLIADDPGHDRYRLAYIECRIFLSDLPGGSSDEAHGFLASALQEADALAADKPADRKYRSLQAQINHALGNQAVFARRQDDAEAHFRRAIELRTALLTEQPEADDQRLALAQTQVNLLQVLQQRKMPVDELQSLVRQTTGLLVESHRRDPSDPRPLIALGALRINWAFVQREQGLTNQALVDVGQTVTALEKFLAREPNWGEARSILRKAYRMQALLHESLGRTAEVADDLRRVIELAPVQDRPGYRLDRIASLIKANKPADAADEIESTAAESKLGPEEVRRLLVGCATLARLDVPVFRFPFQSRMLRAARAALQTAKNDLSAKQWVSLLSDLGKLPELQSFLAHPELRLFLR
jgi:hypothetical protein